MTSTFVEAMQNIRITVKKRSKQASFYFLRGLFLRENVSTIPTKTAKPTNVKYNPFEAPV